METRFERPGALGRATPIFRTDSAILESTCRPNRWAMRTGYSPSTGGDGVTGTSHVPSSHCPPNDRRWAATQAYAERATQ